MANVPLFLVILFAVAMCIKGKAASAGSVALGALLGLTLAGTAVGPPILHGMTSAATSLVSGLSASLGN